MTTEHSDTAKRNRERRETARLESIRENAIKKKALLSALESGELTASEKVEAVKLLNNLK